MPPIPDTVTHPVLRELYQLCNRARAEIKPTAALVNEMRKHDGARAISEAGANITLAYRALEDANMRLGKALQALDGGVSVYDKATTVGAPDASLSVQAKEITRLKADQGKYIDVAESALSALERVETAPPAFGVINKDGELLDEIAVCSPNEHVEYTKQEAQEIADRYASDWNAQWAPYTVVPLYRHPAVERAPS